LREVERIAHIPPKGGKENRILQNLSKLRARAGTLNVFMIFMEMARP
jgi:hypothetical protein